jgi:GTP-binding protein
MFVNNPKYCAANYLAYLKKALRTAFDFTGLPIIIMLRARPKKVVSFHTEGRSSRNRPSSKSNVAKFVRKKKKDEKNQEKKKDRKQNNRSRRGADRKQAKKQSRGKKR